MNALGISPVIAGAAIERAGKNVDALQFYERLLRVSQRNRDQRMVTFATERLVASGDRHAEYLRRKGDETGAQQRVNEAKRLRLRNGLIDKALPEYPDIHAGEDTDDPKSFSTGKQPSVQTAVKMTHSPDGTRVRLEHIDRFEVVTVDSVKREARGDVAVIEAHVPDGALAAWAIPDWDAMLLLVTDGPVTLLRCAVKGDAFEVRMVRGAR